MGGSLIFFGIVASLAALVIYFIWVRNMRRQKAALADSEEQYRALFSNSGVAIAMINENKNFISANEAFLAFIGYEMDELRSMTPIDITHPEDLEKTKKILGYHPTREIRQQRLTKRYLNKDGSVRWGHVVNSQVELSTGKILDFVTITDITEHAAMEHTLSENNRCLKQAQKLAHIGQWSLTICDGDLFWSDEIYQIFEVDPEQFKPSYESFIAAIHPEDRETVDRTYKNSIDTNIPYDITHRLLMKDGRIKYVRELCETEFNLEGIPIRSIGSAQDITDVVERQKKLKEANARLKELDKLKSMFIASMSHELRTPLNSIIGFTSLILDGKIGAITELQKDRLGRVKNAGRHLLSLITDVIDISKIEAGRIDIHIEPFDLNDVIAEAVGEIEIGLKKKGLALAVDVPEKLKLKSDRHRVLQCILNYLSNAVKFTESGQVTVSAKAVNGDVKISVKDTGIGIAEEDFPKLFEAFERLETHLRIKAGGTGLGLYLTKKITRDLLGGEVTVDSTIGEGSVFSIKIPKNLETVQSFNDTEELADHGHYTDN